MKVEKCSCPESVEPKTLSFDEITKKEGIYRHYGGNPDVRLITIAHGEYNVTLYSHGKFLSPASKAGWNNYRFIECPDEVVCFEVRKRSFGARS